MRVRLEGTSHRRHLHQCLDQAARNSQQARRGAADVDPSSLRQPGLDRLNERPHRVRSMPARSPDRPAGFLIITTTSSCAVTSAERSRGAITVLNSTPARSARCWSAMTSPERSHDADQAFAANRKRKALMLDQRPAAKVNETARNGVITGSVMSRRTMRSVRLLGRWVGFRGSPSLPSVDWEVTQSVEKPPTKRLSARFWSAHPSGDEPASASEQFADMEAGRKLLEPRRDPPVTVATAAFQQIDLPRHAQYEGVAESRSSAGSFPAAAESVASRLPVS
jgi:hypothetical protein